MDQILYLTGREAYELADTREIIDVVREAYRQRGEGAPAKPRTTVNTEDPFRLMTNYMTILPDTGVMGGNVSAFAGEPAGGIIGLNDFETGEQLALVESSGWNPFKTSAVGAVGVDTLAREDAHDVGMIGSGRQARAQLRAVSIVRDVETARVFSPTKANREQFAEDMADELAIDVDAVDSSVEAVTGADIVITATTSATPVLDGEQLDEGTHVTTMGNAHHEALPRELDSVAVERAKKYVPDLRARAFQDAGAFLDAVERGIVSEDHLYSELGEIIAGAVPGRESDTEITVFDTGGTAIETVAAAFWLYREATENDAGRMLEFDRGKDF